MHWEAGSSLWHVLFLADISTGTTGLRHTDDLNVQQQFYQRPSWIQQEKSCFNISLTLLQRHSSSNSVEMQKGSGHSVAVVRLRFFAYTAVGASQHLHPLQVTTVRQSKILPLWLNVLRFYCFIASRELCSHNWCIPVKVPGPSFCRCTIPWKLN